MLANVTEVSRDRQLLERFTAGDEAAFAELVERYGPMVWRLCRRLLQHEQDAEDSFQAVFFLLARRARAIRRSEAVGSWLYGVAYRTAMKARRSTTRRHEREKKAAGAMPEHQPWSQAACRELQRLLDEEVERLPEKYRAPFVLCCLEGMSRGEAAVELGWKEGTVSGRLAEARKQLEKRLARRGVTLSAVLTAGMLAQGTASAAPVALLQATSTAVLAPLNTLSPAVVALAESVLGSMGALKAGILCLLAALTLASGASLAALLPAAQVEVEAPAQPKPPPVRTTQIDEQVLALAFSPDGTKLVTTGARHIQPGQLKVWDVATGKNLVRVRGIRGIRAVAWAPDGRSIATGIFGGELRLRDPTTGKDQAVARGHTRGVNGVVFSDDGNLLVTAGLDKVVKLWDRQPLRQKQEFHGHTGMVFSVALFHHGRAIVSGGDDRTARIWDVGTGKETFLLAGHLAPVEMVAISPDDKIVATASWDRTIKLWDPETGQEIGVLPDHDDAILAIAFSPDGKLLASATGSGRVLLWDVEKRLVHAGLGQHAGAAWALAFSPDGKLLASGGSDRTAKLWNVAERKEVASLMTGEESPPPDTEKAPAPAAAAPPLPPRAAPVAEPAPAAESPPLPGGRLLLLLGILLLGALAVLAWLFFRQRRTSAGPLARDGE